MGCSLIYCMVDPSMNIISGCVRTLPAVSESCCSTLTPQAMDWVYAAAQQCREDGRGSLHAFLLQQVTLRVCSSNQQKGEGAVTTHGGTIRTYVDEFHIEQDNRLCSFSLSSNVVKSASCGTAPFGEDVTDCHSPGSTGSRVSAHVSASLHQPVPSQSIT